MERKLCYGKIAGLIAYPLLSSSLDSSIQPVGKHYMMLKMMVVE
jgi:hypothetical protein